MGCVCSLRETSGLKEMAASSPTLMRMPTEAYVLGAAVECLGGKCKQGAAVLLDELIVSRGLLQIKTTTPVNDVGADLSKVGAKQATAVTGTTPMIIPGCILL